MFSFTGTFLIRALARKDDVSGAANHAMQWSRACALVEFWNQLPRPPDRSPARRVPYTAADLVSPQAAATGPPRAISGISESAAVSRQRRHFIKFAGIRNRTDDAISSSWPSEAEIGVLHRH